MTDPMPLASGGTQPPGTPASIIDNPPRIRPMSVGVPSEVSAMVQPTAAEPFMGFSYLDVLNIKVAMEARLHLLADEKGSADNIASVNRILKVAIVKLGPAAGPPQPQVYRPPVPPTLVNPTPFASSGVPVPPSEIAGS